MPSRFGLSLVPLALVTVLSISALAQNAKPDLKPWHDGVVEAKSDAGFVFMASKGGFAESEGLALDMVQFKGDALALRAMLAGDLDSYEGNPGGPLIAASRGADIKIIGCYWPVLTNGIFTRNSIGSIAELKGKAFAISSPGALPDLFARAVLTQNGIADSDVKFAVMGSDADRFRALSAGIADAAVISTEFEPLAASQGVKLLVHPHDAAPNYLRFCINTSSATLAKRHDDVVHFLAAEMKSLRFALANRDKVLDLTRQITDAKPDDPRPAYIFDEVKKYGAIDPEMPIPAEKLDWLQDLLVKTGNLAQKFDVKTMIDDGPRQEALALAGK
ncbi:MAG TPA: ABC transporter substrate-binding protein [Xanthobacteraceae bacterium]|jgi:NitT/TauT family transport system substrate-binding protein|nr:ABC transporter substrate-binding protein [Xanthobacteraceae bacterium]